MTSGPRIVFLTLAVIAGITAIVFQTGTWPESAHSYLRLTGRLALILFILSFGASTLNRVFHADWTRFLLINRRYLGISTAITLWAHFSVILMLIAFEAGWKETNAPLMILIPGVTTFALVGLMGLTSNNTARQKLGIRNWKRLHLIGGYAALSAFIFEYVLQLFLIPELATLAPVFAYSLLTVTVIFLLLRLAGRRIDRGAS